MGLNKCLCNDVCPINCECWCHYLTSEDAYIEHERQEIEAILRREAEEDGNHYDKPVYEG